MNYSRYFVHSQKRRLLAFCGFSPFLIIKREPDNFDTAEMHVHGCTLSVSMHIETVSHLQSYDFSLRIKGFKIKKSAPHKQREKKIKNKKMQPTAS